MTFKAFESWCNNRACDGCWSLAIAITCIKVMQIVKTAPFWKREKTWRAINEKYGIEKNIVLPINEKIEALAKSNEA